MPGALVLLVIAGPFNHRIARSLAEAQGHRVPRILGDGAVDYVVTIEDIQHNVLATSAKHTATTRITGAANSLSVTEPPGYNHFQQQLNGLTPRRVRATLR
jgi:hypothetical protein